MSRVGKKTIEIPASVEVRIEGGIITVKGPKGELIHELHPHVRVIQEGNTLTVEPVKHSARGTVPKSVRALWGLTRALIANMIGGVTEGYVRRLEIEGVGYRANVEGDTLVLNIGFSHPVSIKAPEGVTFAVERNTISVSGIDKHAVGEWAARIRRVRPVEPYKGKGIKYEGEVVRRKAGKKVAAAK